MYRAELTRLPCWIAILLLAQGGAGVVVAQTELRWQLKSGQELAVHFEQQTESRTTVNKRPVQLLIEMNADMRWRVDRVENDGSLRMTQSFERLGLSLALPDGEAIRFDSASGQAPVGKAQDLADAVHPLLNAPFQLHLSPRGEVLEVELPEELEARLDALPDGSGLRQLLSREGLEQTLRQSAPRLPAEPVKPGDSWEQEIRFDLPPGKLKQTSRYTYRGPQAIDGRTLEQIDVQSQLAVEPAPNRAAKMAIKDQSTTGTLWFDRAAGRLHGSEIQQRIVSETPYRDTQIRVEIKSRLELSIREAEAAK